MKKNSFILHAFIIMFILTIIVTGCRKKRDEKTDLNKREPKKSLKITDDKTDKNTIKIAVILALTGESAVINKQHLNAIELAVHEKNSRGGIMGKNIELIILDNQSSSLTSKKMAVTAVESGAVAVIGATWSSHSLAMAPVLQEAGIPMISHTSTHLDLTRTGNYIFRVCYTDPFQGYATAQFAYNYLKAKNAAVLTNTAQTYSLGLSEVFKYEYVKIGGSIIREYDYLPGVTNFDTLVKDLKIQKPDVIFLPGYPEDSGLIIKKAREIGIDVPFIGGDGWDETMLIIAGNSMNNCYYSEQWHPDFPGAKSKIFIEKYESKYGTIENLGIALAYDAIEVLLYAIEISGSPDPAAIRKAIAGVKNFTGISGKISFNQYGDTNKPAVILKFEAKKLHYVKLISTDNQ